MNAYTDLINRLRNITYNCDEISEAADALEYLADENLHLNKANVELAKKLSSVEEEIPWLLKEIDELKNKKPPAD